MALVILTPSAYIANLLRGSPLKLNAAAVCFDFLLPNCIH